MIEPAWPALQNVRACSTTRLGGVSQAPFDSLNLALHVGDSADAVLNNRQRLVSELQLQQPPLWLNQQHTTELVYFPEIHEETPVADACWSDVDGQACVVMTADCMPILLCDRAGTWVCAIHAGWKGLLDGIVEQSLQRILEIKGTEPADVLAWIGPAISQENFEVGAEVREAFVYRHAFSDKYFAAKEGTEQKYLADLDGIAQQILRQKGLREITSSGLCTYADPQQFYSYRYACHSPLNPNDKGRTGRIATLIWLENLAG